MDRRTFFMALVGGIAVTAGLASTCDEARAAKLTGSDMPEPSVSTATSGRIASESPQDMQSYDRRPRRIVVRRPRRVVVRRPRRVVVYRRRPVYVAPRRRVIYRRRYW